VRRNGGLSILDEDGEELVLDAGEAAALLALTHDFDTVTVSACPACRARVVACVALVDLLGAAPPHARGRELLELAEDAPTLHLYVQDLGMSCDHPTWRDPGFTEWADVVEGYADARRAMP
jgi:hypothetical protein